MTTAIRCLGLGLLYSATLTFAAEVRQFSPQGRIDAQTRATAQFTGDMAALGDTTAAAPFAVNCGPVKGEGRWVDARNWAWQLERPLAAGERCEFTLTDGLASLDGKPLTGRRQFAFFAAGPWPRNVMPRAGSAVDEEQAFILDGGGPLDGASIERSVWCEAAGVGNRIPVRQVPEAQRADILKHAYQNAGTAPVVVSCAERLPPGVKMKLAWGKGVLAANGTPTDKERSFAYTVREPFRASVSCEREKSGQPCSPLSPISVNFSAHAETKLLRQVRLVTPEGTRSPKDDSRAEGAERQSMSTSVSFPGPWPQNAELRIELPPGIKDDAGRPLANAASFPLKLATGALPPLAKFPGAFGILELKEGGLLPVTLRNVEDRLASAGLRLPGGHRFADQRLSEDGDVIAAMRALARFEQQTRKVRIERGGKLEDSVDPYYARELSFLAGRSGVDKRELPKPGGSAEFEVIGIPLARPGYHIVEIESRLLGAALLATPRPMYVRSAVLVTNLAVHLKRGRDNALVWVTSLDAGRPVEGAEVRVSRCDGTELWRGRTDKLGRAAIDRRLEAAPCEGGKAQSDEGDYGYDGSGFLFASARLGEDYSFVRSDWTEGIEPWRFGVDTWGEQSDSKIHTVFDRTLLRPGQTVSMKHIARGRDSRGFRIPAAAELPDRLIIRHAEEGTEYAQPLSWDASDNAGGSAVSQWRIPDAAKRGNYEVSLTGGKRAGMQSGQFRVGDFRLPVFTGSVQGVPNRQVAPGRVPLALGLSFLNGGAAKGAQVSVNATLRPRWPTYERYEPYNFSIDFNDEALTAFGVGANREQEKLVLDAQAVKLDQAGAGKLEVALPEKPKGPSELYAEMSFTDPNGEIQTLHGSVELWPAALVLGIKVSDWAASSGSGNRVEIVALDTSGKPLAGQEVTVRGKRRIDYSHRRRIVGGFYAYEHQSEFIDLGEVCAGRTDARGLLVCEPRTEVPGSVYLLAESRDRDGNVARTSTSYWVAGGGDLWFTVGNQDRIDVIPEQRSVKPGETARLQVRTPFREATALISVEAGGIVETFVQPLSRYKPVIELAVKGEWAPNVYVSVLAVRGRVEPLKWYSLFQWGWREPLAWFREWWNPQQPTAMVDLAKPAYRIGLAELAVGTDAFKLQVEVAADRQDYRPRETATVRLKVRKPDGTPAAGGRVAFAAVDQALLELRPNESWNLLEAMLQKRPYEVSTATAQSQVIGKRHFGKKALPPGGGGGRGPARELFDTLLLWQPQVALDGEGAATLKVPINDSLTEFKLVGVATAGPALFGTGSGAIRTRQDLQLISGLPPLVREKDAFQALLTLRNGTARAMNVTVTARAGERTLETRQVRLDKEGAAELAWSTQAPEGTTQLAWEFEAREEGGQGAADRLRIVQAVEPAVPVTVQQATMARIEGRYEVPAAPPAGALPGRGGIELGLSAKLSTPPPGLRRYLESYPYGCLEQKTSIAVGLRDQARWQAMTAELPALLDADGLARYFAYEGPGSVALTAYVLDMAALSGFALPEEAKRRMLQGLAAFVEGRIKPRHWAPQDDLLVRKLGALEALTRAGQMPTRVAAALDVEPLRLPTAALIDWTLVVRRLPELPQRAARLAAAEQELRNRLSYAGGRLAFSTEKSDYWWWLMVNGDANAFRLIEAMMDEPAWREDLPRLVRGAVERQVRGRWFTTTANAWARLALDRFGQAFEREPVAGVSRARLGKATAELRWPAPEPATLSLPWPAGTSDKSSDKLAVEHEGTGKPWANLQVLAAMPASAPRAFGYRVSRQVTPVQEKEKGKVSRGDLWRVRLDIEADQDMTWVVVADPVPAGARILGDGDGRDSRIATMDEDVRKRGLWPTFVERTFGFFRAYYEVVPRGRFSIEYTLRLNNAGDFALPPTRVEALYAPDVFGEAPNARVVVGN